MNPAIRGISQRISKVGSQDSTSAVGPASARRGLAGALDQVEGRAGAGEQAPAGLAGGNPLAAAFEERTTEFLLQGPHGAADGTVGQAQGLGGTGKVLQAGGGLDSAGRSARAGDGA